MYLLKIPVVEWQWCPTFITNFDLYRLALLEEAIYRYGDPDLVVIDYPMLPMLIGGSLHYLKKSARSAPDLSSFWALVRVMAKNGWVPTMPMLPATVKTVTKSVDPIKAYDKAMKGI